MKPFAQLGSLRVTWSCVASLDDSLGRAFERAHLSSDAPVAIVARSTPTCLASIMAVLRRGRCAVLISPLLPDVALAADVRAVAPAAVIADAREFDRPGFREAVGESAVVEVQLTNVAESTCDIAIHDSPAHRATSSALFSGAAITTLTSGTTGPPKRLPVSWETLVEMGGGDRPRDPSSDVGATILSLPLASLGGMSSIARAIFSGRPTAMMERFDVWAWSELVREHRPSVIGAPPPVLQMILDENVPTSYFEGVTAFVTGSAAVAPAVAAAFYDRYEIPVLLTYGATEFLAGVTGWTLDLYHEFATTKLGSVGRCLPGVELRVIDEETFEQVPTDHPGILEVDPPRRTGNLPSGWLRTSDRARIDHDGFVWILGRTDDVIIRGGFKIDLNDVARVIGAHPSVGEVCVVGLPDPRVGMIPGAVVALCGTPPGESELADMVRAALPGYAVPSEIRVVAEMPLTPTMKPDRAAVRELLLAGDLAD
jgi:long-chain acyl-CoA synthetase